jgi:chorismate dehydratase
MAKLRLGKLTYINCLPVYYGFDTGKVRCSAELISGYPTELNSWLKEGKLDISPVSSIEYARNQEEYLLLPDLSLNSLGQVRSVLLFSKKPIGKLNGKAVALSTRSATSVVLLKVLLKEMFKVRPKYYQCRPGFPEVLKEADAALIIGDEALSAKVRADLYQYDLGSLWQEWTGYPVVFVVWAVRKQSNLVHKDDVRNVYKAIRRSLRVGLSHLDDVAETAKMLLPDSRVDLRHYYDHLGYTFDNKMQEALLAYYLHAAETGLSPPCRRLRFYPTG